MVATWVLPTVSVAVVVNKKEDVKYKEYNGNLIFYSDDYFRHSSTEYDPHLATLSVIMTDNTVPRNNPKSANDTEWYTNQPKLLKGFFDTIGFEEFEANEDYKKRTEFDTIGVACAKRQVDDYTLIAVTVRSGGYFHEWANNGNLESFQYDLKDVLEAVMKSEGNNKTEYNVKVDEFLVEGKNLNMSLGDLELKQEFKEYNESNKEEFMVEFEEHLVPSELYK